MAIPAPNTDFGHTALTMKLSYFTKANCSAYMNPTIPGTSPTNPNSTSGALTRSTPELQQDPFLDQEAIRQFVHEQQIYATWRTAHTLLKNQIINSVCDQYIQHLKDPRTKYATVTANNLLAHLWKTYGIVDTANLTANEKRMKA